ncbi:hypothetical protein B566_EDAN008947 [Ephemera danica]|nr:hypothetical protein B566_EDAN008947 [Ephemera danica]
MQLCQVFFLVFVASVVSGQHHDDIPAAKDPRIQKQPPHHWGTPAPNSGVKLDFIPFRMLASVRHEQVTKHLPRSEALATALTPAEIILAKRLKESITTHKLGEVYTEQGYEDDKYDHGYYEKQGEFRETYENNDRGKIVSKKPHLLGDASTNVPIKYHPKRGKVKFDSKKYPYYHTVSKDSPLRYATNPGLIPNKKNGETPFYDSTNYKECPEISPEIKIGPDVKHPAGEPRLKGLGDKIDCLKSKYFSEDPFDNPFFKEDEVEAITEAATTLLPSESGAILHLVNSTKPDKSLKKKVEAETEHIEGLLPPPRRVKRGIEVLSSRRGGVKFTDLDSDGSDIDTARLVTAHRVTPGNRFGVKEGRNTEARATRPRSRNYEVTEEPEEAQSNRFTNRNSSPRRVQVEHHRVTQEETYSSTYVPASDDLGEVMTTTVWNAAPEPEAFTPRSSFEEQPSTKSRARSRPSVAAVREDAFSFESRGEKRKQGEEKSNSDLLRSRSRARVKPVEAVKSEPIPTTYAPAITQEPQEAFIVATENIPVVPTESYELTPTSEKTIKSRPIVQENFRIPTEKIPETRARLSSNDRRPSRPPPIPGAIPIPIDEILSRMNVGAKKPPPIPGAIPAPLEGDNPRRRPPPIPGAIPAPLEGDSARREGARRAPHVPGAIPVPTDGENTAPRPRRPQVPNAIPVPVDDQSSATDAPIQSRRQEGISPRSKSGRLEAIRGRKQDFSAKIPSEPSRHASRQRNAEQIETPRQQIDSPRQQIDSPRQSRHRSRVSTIDPVQNAEVASETPSRVNRQQNARAGRARVHEVEEQRVDAPRRASPSRRAQPQQEAVATSATNTRRGRPVPESRESEQE